MVYDVLNNLIDKVDLPTIQSCVIKIFRESLFCSFRVQTNNLTHKLTQELGTNFGFIVLFGSNLAPQNILQSGHVF